MNTNMKDIIINELNEKGYYHHKKSEDIEEFYDLCRSIGRIDHLSDVQIEAKAPDQVSQPIIKTAGPLFYHQDDLGLDYLAWWCKRSPEDYEPTIFIPVSAFIRKLKPETIKTFETSYLENEREHYFTKEDKVPLLENGHFYVASPVKLNRLAAQSVEKKAAVEDLFENMIAAEETDAIEVHLEQGQILILDNRRFVHGRRSLSPNSKRILHRAWVKKV